jgi:hypothetical protein
MPEATKSVQQKNHRRGWLPQSADRFSSAAFTDVGLHRLGSGVSWDSNRRPSSLHTPTSSLFPGDALRFVPLAGHRCRSGHTSKGFAASALINPGFDPCVDQFAQMSFYLHVC